MLVSHENTIPEILGAHPVNAITRAAPEGTPRGGSVSIRIFVNTALPRRASERP